MKCKMLKKGEPLKCGDIILGTETILIVMKDGDIMIDDNEITIFEKSLLSEGKIPTLEIIFETPTRVDHFNAIRKVSK